MKAENSIIRLAATDLSNHLTCRHLTAIELAVARGTKKAPLWKNPDAWVLQQRGLEQEQSYVQHLQEMGRNVADLRQVESEDHAIAETSAAMKRGVDVIVQATMHSGRWLGPLSLRSPVRPALTPSSVPPTWPPGANWGY